MAKRFEFKLEQVLRYTARMTEMKKIEFALARREYLLSIQAKEEMERSRVIAVNDKRDMLKDSAPLDMLRVYEAYIARLKDDIIRQDGVIEEKAVLMEEKRHEYISWRKKRKSLEKLKERALTQHDKEVTAEETKFNDEMGIIRHRRRER